MIEFSGIRSAKAKSIRMSIDDAIRLHEAGRLREAEHLYRSMLDAEPRHPDALHLLGVLLTQVGEYGAAVEHIQAALKVDRESALFRSSLAQAYFRAGRLAEAVQTLQDVVAQRPDSFQAFSDLGAALQESGQPERAIEAYRRAIALNPDLAVVHFNLGTALKQGGCTAEAIASVERAIALDPTGGGYFATLAGYQLEAGNPEAALGACRACLAIAPRNLTALTFMSIALARLGDTEAASRIVDLDRLIHQRILQPPPGYAGMAAFNEALAEHVRSHPTLEKEPGNNATRHGKHTGNLLADPSGPIPAFARLVESAVTDYLRTLPVEPGHPYLAHRPKDFRLMMWSVVMESQGHQLAHMHPDGWVSGVYYVALPAVIGKDPRSRDGWIEFGRPLPELMGPWRPEVRALRPEEGMVVLFPSYFYHETIPFESTEQRICIAFDAVPRFR